MSDEQRLLIKLIIRIEMANELHAIFTIKNSPEYKDCVTSISLDCEKLIEEIETLRSKLY